MSHERFLFFILALVVVLLWWQNSAENRESRGEPFAQTNVPRMIPPPAPQPQKNRELRKSQTLQKPESNFIESARPAKLIPIQSTNDPHQPPAGAVPFDLIGQYVVAYGDILIGRANKPDFPKSGFIEAPKMQLWETNEIPFSIHNTLKNPERVMRTIQYFNSHTPVKFVPYDGQPDSIVFVPGEDLCLSYLGRVQGHQPIYLSDKCSEREIGHEILHALGFVHEQSRPDRDRYLRILWPNIQEQHQDQFMTVPEGLFEALRERPFDYRSVMLYHAEAFAKQPGLLTLESLGQAIDPVASGLSDEDLARIWLLYNR